VLVKTLLSPFDNDELVCCINFTQCVTKSYSQCFCVICILWLMCCT